MELIRVKGIGGFLMRYFFHQQRPSGFIRDDEGSEFVSYDAMRTEALLSARELLAEQLRQGRAADDSEFVVMDEAGHVALVLPFRKSIEGGPA